MSTSSVDRDGCNGSISRRQARRADTPRRPWHPKRRRYAWSAGTEVIFIGLTSPDGEALLQAPTRQLVDFLGRTYALCAQGQEPEHLDVDGAIEALLTT